MIARVSTLLYGLDSEKLREAGVLRAEAMAYRDACGVAIADADWLAIETRLTEAYEILKREVSNGRPRTSARSKSAMISTAATGRPMGYNWFSGL